MPSGGSSWILLKSLIILLLAGEAMSDDFYFSRCKVSSAKLSLATSTFSTYEKTDNLHDKKYFLSNGSVEPSKWSRVKLMD